MDRSKWEYKKLGEVCAPKSDILRANKLFGNDDIIDYVDISSIDNTTHCITQPTSYVFKEAPSRAQQKVEQGDVLYSLVRPNLKNIAVVTSSDTDKYVASSGFCVLRGKDVETRYLYHMVLGDTFTNYILGLVSGANYPAVREDDVKGFSFRCPPLADQQRIAAELDCLNEMIALNQEQLKEFDKLAQSIFYDMFGDPVANEKGWDINRLEENVTLINGRAYKQDELLSDGKYKVIRVGNFFSNSTYYYSDLELENDKYCEAGDLLYTWSASFGARIWEGEKVIYHYHIWKVNYDVKRYNKLFLCYLLNVLTEKFKENVHGVTMVHLTKAGMEKTEIPLPPLALQQKFAEKIQAIEAQKELVKKSIAETQQLLNSRMDYYFD